MKDVEQCSVYLRRGIAKRLNTDKQSTPTPNRISIPLVGEWICDKHERFLDCLLPVLKNLAIFYERIKHETLQTICSKGYPFVGGKVMKKNANFLALMHFLHLSE